MSDELPPWDPAMSDGCSVPHILRPLIPLETPEQVKICKDHDEAYYYGGTREEKFIADHTFAIKQVEAKMPLETVRMYLKGVEVFGEPHYKQRGVSWGWGGDRFCYDVTPRPAWDAGGT